MIHFPPPPHSELYLDQNAVLSAREHDLTPLLHRKRVHVVPGAQLALAHLFSRNLELNQGYQNCMSLCLINGLTINQLNTTEIWDPP